MPEGYIVLAAELGFEPRQTVSETGVLPLHNSAVSINDQRSIANQNMKINMFIKFKSDRLKRRHRADLGELLPHLSHILINGKLVPRVPQRERRMVRRHDVKTVLLDEESPDVSHYRLLAEKGLIRRRAAKEYHLGTHQSELLGEQWLACMDLRRCRAPVLGRTAFRDIADMIVLFGKTIGIYEILEELA